MRDHLQSQSVYVHVPFCAHKCDYCAFYSASPQAGQMDRYVQALILEMDRRHDGPAPATLYFGGGTPSLLTVHQWRRLLQAMERLGLSGAAEWTVECNPATLTEEKARLLKDYGVNRLSLGVQSLDEALLQKLGRPHDRRQALQAFDRARKAGFDNVNLDLMFAIPGQTLEVWRATLTEALSLGSEHLSTYEVTYEEDTPLYEQLRAGQFAVEEDLAYAMYDELRERASLTGLCQYEVSNFARDDGSGRTFLPNRACRHNVNYWRGGAYVGLGPSAASFSGATRSRNWANTTLYCEMLEAGRLPVESREELPPLRRAGEIAAFGLRMNAGWPFPDFQRVTGFSLLPEWSAEMAQLTAAGWGELDEQGFRLNQQGLLFADYAAELFLR